jgi:hypothetical protein
MPKRLSLPGGSFLEVTERDEQRELEERRERLTQKLEADLAHSLESIMVDPEEFERDLMRNVDSSLSPFLDPNRPEDLRAEQALERRAGPAIVARLKRNMQAAAGKEEQARERGTIGQLFGPTGHPLEDY